MFSLEMLSLGTIRVELAEEERARGTGWVVRMGSGRGRVGGRRRRLGQNRKEDLGQLLV